MKQSATWAAALALATLPLSSRAGLDATVYAGWWRNGVLYGGTGDISFDASAALGSFVDAQIDHWDDSIYYRWNPLGRDELYSVRWTGYLLTPAAGLYEFRLTSDDGNQLLLGGSKVIDSPALQWYGVSTGQATLAAGAVALELRFYENYSFDGIRLEWRPPDATDWEVIPASALVTSVPEPRTWALMLGGLALLGRGLHRRWC